MPKERTTNTQNGKSNTQLWLTCDYTMSERGIDNIWKYQEPDSEKSTACSDNERKRPRQMR